MANKDLLRTPHLVRGDDDFLWYEEPAGVTIVVRVHGVPGQSTMVKRISWRALRNALKRKDK